MAPFAYAHTDLPTKYATRVLGSNDIRREIAGHLSFILKTSVVPVYTNEYVNWIVNCWDANHMYFHHVIKLTKEGHLKVEWDESFSALSSDLLVQIESTIKAVLALDWTDESNESSQDYQQNTKEFLV